jgi:hypothetical protein
MFSVVFIVSDVHPQSPAAPKFKSVTLLVEIKSFKEKGEEYASKLFLIVNPVRSILILKVVHQAVILVFVHLIQSGKDFQT